MSIEQEETGVPRKKPESPGHDTTYNFTFLFTKTFIQINNKIVWE